MKKQDRRIKVAVIDDSEYFRHSLSFLMEKLGFVVVFQAENGYDCLEQMSALQEPPHVCILDIFMPKMNGMETARQIKVGWPSVKIIACSTINEKGTIDEMIAAGADVFLLKDTNAKEFKKIILQLSGAKDSL